MPKRRALVSFTIEGRLPALNDLILAATQHWSKYQALKKQGERMVRGAIMAKLDESDVFTSVAVHYKFYEKRGNRDRDNVISAGMKIINDALVKEGVIEDDDQKGLVLIEASVEVWTTEAIDVIIEGERANGTRADRRRKILERAASQKRARAKKKVDAQHRRLHDALLGPAAEPGVEAGGAGNAQGKGRRARRRYERH